jgi:GAF domain-containing protein
MPRSARKSAPAAGKPSRRKPAPPRKPAGPPAVAEPRRAAGPGRGAQPDRDALRLDRLERLQRLTAQLSAALTPEEVAALIIAEGFGLVPARAVLLYVEREPGLLELSHAFGVSERAAIRQRRLSPTDPSPAADAYRIGEAVWLRSAEELASRYPEFAELARADGDEAAAALPVVAAGSRGALLLLFDAVREFDAEERGFVLAVARQCAQALERARLYHEQQKLTQRISGLQEATAALSAAATPAQVAAATFGALARVGAKDGALYHVPAPGRLELVFRLGFDEETAAALVPTALDAVSPAGARPPQDVWLPTGEAIRARYPALEPLRSRRAIGGLAVLPLTIEGRAVGALAFSVGEDRSLEPDDRPYAAALALQCAQALERSRAYEAQKRLAERVSALHSTAAALSGAVSPQEMVEHGFRALATLGASGAEIHVLDGSERVVLLVRHGTAPAGRAEAVSIDAPAPAAEVVRTGRALWLETPEEIAARYPELEPVRKWRGEGAWALVPLLAGGRTLGALVASFPAARRFDADERTFLRALAQPCAQAVERARLFEAAATQQAQAEESAEVLEQMFQLAPVGVALLAPDLRFLRVNRALAAFHGSPADAHPGKTPAHFLPGPAGEAIAAVCRRVLETGEPALDVTIAGETAADPGTTRRWGGSFYPVRAGGRLVGIGVVMRDLKA